MSIDDEDTPPERKRKLTVPTAEDASNNDWNDTPTGRHRLVRAAVHAELGDYINGSLERMEKGARWTRVLIYFVSLGVGVAVALLAADRWISSVAKKEEVTDLRASVAVVNAKVDSFGVVLGEIKELVKTKKGK